LIDDDTRLGEVTEGVEAFLLGGLGNVR